MAAPKGQTLQQRFGFQDGDLKTPLHDEIMLWLDVNIQKIIESSFYHKRKIKAEWGKRFDGHLSSYKKEIDKCFDFPSSDLCRETMKDVENYEYSYDGGTNNLEHKEILKERLKKKKFECEKKWEILGEKPSVINGYGIEIINKKWEVPVNTNPNHGPGNRYNFIVGFVDFRATYLFKTMELIKYDEGLKYEFSFDGEGTPNLRYKGGEGLRYSENDSGRSNTLDFEVKTSIPSLGELFRQLNMYKEYSNNKIVVVCPDDRFSQQIKEQGVLFLKYDPNMFL